MAALISTLPRLETRIRYYHKHAKELAELMPYNRAWYALREKGEWFFGPSKFVGYEDLNPEEYLDRKRGDLDGRVTEGVLKQWAELVEEGHSTYGILHTALNEFCARFGKKPNSLARISIVKTNHGDTTSEPMFADDLVPLMVAVFLKLTPAQKSAFRKQTA